MRYNWRSRLQNCPFSFSGQAQSTVRSDQPDEPRSGEISPGSLKCPGIKTTTEDGGRLCGIRRRESFSDEQDAVGVSIVSTSNQPVP